MSADGWRSRIVLGITGASGVIYGYELAKALVEKEKEIHLIVSKPGWDLISMELGLDRGSLENIVHRVYDGSDMDCALSSGSYLFDSMAIVPCSMRTLGAIASGVSGSLIPRVAEVCLKERRRLVVVPRETPLSLIHIRNMETVTLAGAVVLPAMPGFYHGPESMEDLVNHVVGKVLDQLGIEHEIFRRWKGHPRNPDTRGS